MAADDKLVRIPFGTDHSRLMGSELRVRFGKSGDPSITTREVWGNDPHSPIFRLWFGMGEMNIQTEQSYFSHIFNRVVHAPPLVVVPDEQLLRRGFAELDLATSELGDFMMLQWPNSDNYQRCIMLNLSAFMMLEGFGSVGTDGSFRIGGILVGQVLIKHMCWAPFSQTITAAKDGDGVERAFWEFKARTAAVARRLAELGMHGLTRAAKEWVVDTSEPSGPSRIQDALNFMNYVCS